MDAAGRCAADCGRAGIGVQVDEPYRTELSKTDRDYLASVAKKKPEVTETTVDAFSGEIGKLINVEMTTDLYYRDVKEVSETFRNLRLYETDFFLFSSDIPAAQARPFIKALDTMHHAMCKMYRIKRGTPVWKGKAVIIAFSRRAEYVAFQQKFMQNTPAEHNHGRCRSYRSGRVIISAYYFGSASQFAQLLVHETTHGVNYRFRTTVHLPSWINEGIADVVGDSLVPMCKTVKGKESVAMRALKKTPRVGANFFDTNRSIETWQYGVASSLTRFLIKTNPQSFAAFIEGIKEGMTAEESLRRHYGVTFPELLTAYGRAVGVPNLRN
ncbi:MAG: hypothetical protein IID44_19855 [Planctomycetes bacterium]|nr:hypothetical protein [Planctomycetota bacterium]